MGFWGLLLRAFGCVILRDLLHFGLLLFDWLNLKFGCFLFGVWWLVLLGLWVWLVVLLALARVGFVNFGTLCGFLSPEMVWVWGFGLVLISSCLVLVCLFVGFGFDSGCICGDLWFWLKACFVVV